jgi:hypothetical protein
MGSILGGGLATHRRGPGGLATRPGILPENQSRHKFKTNQNQNVFKRLIIFLSCPFHCRFEHETGRFSV